MKIPCVCEKGFHTVTANEMVDIIGAFQRGELTRLRYRRGAVTGVTTECLLSADMGTSGDFTGHCNVEAPDGRVCKWPRRHREGRHGFPVKGPEKRV